MQDISMPGTRIRQRRVSVGLRQAELAKAAGISPSYLNLIEHNRRRIGGKTLVQIAQALDVEPSVISEGVETQLLSALQEAAGGMWDNAPSLRAKPELERLEEFTARFPGWAALIADLRHQREGLERTVKALTERLAHDPQLSTTLHEVISTVTSIRSTAAILAETRELEPEWQMRFHRNINEDGARLAEGAEALMRYLEAAPEAGSDIVSPHEQVQAFLEANAFHFPQLEGWGAEPRVEALVQELPAGPSQALLRAILRQYLEDARAIPIKELELAIRQHGLSPDLLARSLDCPMAQVFRRLAVMPEEMVGPVGLVVVDAAGAMLFRKTVLGFVTPRSGAGCALLPLFEVLGQPSRPVQATLLQGELRLRAMAVAEEVTPPSFDLPALTRAHMLLLPDQGGEAQKPARAVGVTCRICPIPRCEARREPSVLQDAF